MVALIVLNGPPAVGKSTLARRYADDHPMCLRIDIDELRDWLGAWRGSPDEAGRRARSLATTMVRDHLRAGHDVVIAQLYGVPDHLDELAGVAKGAAADFHELVLMADVGSTLDRFVARGGPRLDEVMAGADGLHTVATLHERVAALVATRPRAVVVRSVAGDIEATYAALLTARG